MARAAGIASAASGPSGSKRSPAVARRVRGVRGRRCAGTAARAVSMSGSSIAAAASGSDAGANPGVSARNTSFASAPIEDVDELAANSKTWTRLPVLPASKTTA